MRLASPEFASSAGTGLTCFSIQVVSISRFFMFMNIYFPNPLFILEKFQLREPTDLSERKGVKNLHLVDAVSCVNGLHKNFGVCRKPLGM